jgi:hypothetical protein
MSVATQAMSQISDEDLAKVAQRLNQHHIGLSLGLLAQDNTPVPARLRTAATTSKATTHLRRPPGSRQSSNRPASTSQSLQESVVFLRNLHMRLGIIYNADAPATTANDEYLEAARQHFVQIEQNMHIVPDMAVFASWVRFPRRAISDQSGLGQDYLVKEYVKLRNDR